jgi:hypothetical protein
MSTTITSSMLNLYRQQFESFQHIASASLSGIERAQQSALETYRQALGQQIELASRASSQATQAVLDPEAVRPAVEGIIKAQRDFAQAVTDTQQRVAQVVSREASSDQSGPANLASSYADLLRDSVDQWQRWTQQVFQVAREQAETLTRDTANRAQQQGHQQAGRSQQQEGDASRRLEQAAGQARRPEARTASGSAQRSTETA